MSKSGNARPKQNVLKEVSSILVEMGAAQDGMSLILDLLKSQINLQPIFVLYNETQQ